MAYVKNVWTDQDVERPRTYRMTENQDGSVTLIDDFGLVTDLGTPVNADNMNHIEDGIAGAVDKTGDTMTGDLTFDDSEVVIKNPNIILGTTPSTSQYSRIVTFQDANDTNIGTIYYRYTDTGVVDINIAVRKQDDSDTLYCRLGYNENGSGYFSFPNSTCVDSQWEQVSQTINSNPVSVNGSTNLSYTLNLPNDGFNYEVMITANVVTGSTSGNTVTAQVTSDLQTNWINIARARTRTSNTVASTGTVIVPVSSSHKIYLTRDTGNDGTVQLYMRAYRRMGTNN